MANKKKKTGYWEALTAAAARLRATKIWEKYIKEDFGDDAENFLFLSAGDELIIRGMHFPDSELLAGAGPVIFETAEKNVYIAAWSQQEIIKALTNIENENEKKDMSAAWMAVLEKFQNEALAKIDAGEINRMF